jgi:hypothetical protein
VFKLIPTMQPGQAPVRVWERYSTMEMARDAVSVLLRDAHILRVMIVRDGPKPALVEWMERS